MGPDNVPPAAIPALPRVVLDSNIMSNAADGILAITIEDPKSQETGAGTGVGRLSFVSEEVSSTCISDSSLRTLANLQMEGDCTLCSPLRLLFTHIITMVNLAVSHKSSPVVLSNISEEHCMKSIRLWNTFNPLHTTASISVRQKPIGVAGMSDKYGKWSWAICVSPATDLFTTDEYPRPDENAKPSTILNTEKLSRKSTTFTTTKLLCGVRASTDAFGLLKSVASGLFYSRKL